MKRTGEIVLTVIGIIINFIVGGFVTFLVLVLKNDTLQDEIEKEFAKDPDLSTLDPSTVLDAMGNGGWAIVIASLIGIILGIIAAINLKGNRKPKLAGILLIVGAVISGLLSIGVDWLPALLFLIAGIMSLVRKPKALI